MSCQQKRTGNRQNSWLWTTWIHIFFDNRCLFDIRNFIFNIFRKWWDYISRATAKSYENTEKSALEEILLKMFLEILLTLLFPSADSLMVTMQVWNVYKSLQTNVLDRDNIFFSFNLSFHCSQPNGSFPDDPSYVQWRNRFLLPEFSVSVCIRWKSITNIKMDTSRPVHSVNTSI